MDRIEAIRQIVDDILLRMTDNEERRCAYLHLYGVAQACALLAVRRHMDVELAVIAGMLHDIYAYAHMDSNDHARHGAVMARDILWSTGLFTEAETEQICAAIAHHSDKKEVHQLLDELLKDADVMQHVLYNPLLAARGLESARFTAMKEELGI